MSKDDAFQTDVRDNGRRGEPLPGCDCLRCFGYCLVDRDGAFRETADRREAAAAVEAGDAMAYDATAGDDFDAERLACGPAALRR